MYIFPTRVRIYKTITKEKLDDAMEEGVHGRGNGFICFIICTFHSYF